MGKYTCSEWAIKRLTGRDILKEEQLRPTEFGLENLPNILNPPCKLLRNKNAIHQKNVILRIVPTGQKERHSVILRTTNKKAGTAVIEDQSGKHVVNLRVLMQEWAKTKFLYAKCG